MSKKSSPSLWGFGAAAIYVGFVLFILALVLYASVQDVQLVEDGYYEESLEYQDRIDNIRHSNSLSLPLNIEHRLAEGRILLTFPPDSGAGKLGGQVRMIRPSNARLDQSWPVEPDQDGAQVVSTRGMARGKWRIEIDWHMDSVGYYDEARIVIP